MAQALALETLILSLSKDEGFVSRSLPRQHVPPVTGLQRAPPAKGATW